MPLVTEIVRNGKSLKLPWTEFHLNCMFTAALKDCKAELKFENGGTIADLPDGVYLDFVWRNPIYLLHIPECPLLARGEQTLLGTYEFPYMEDEEEKVFALLPGDRLLAHRESKPLPI